MNASATDALFEYLRITQPDGSTTEEVRGNPWVAQRDGNYWLVGPGRLDTPDGDSFGVDWDLWQDEDAGPVFARMRVVPVPRLVLDDDERQAAWLEQRPESNEDTYSAWLAERSARLSWPTFEPTTVDALVWEEARRSAEDEFIPVTIVFRNGPGLLLPPSPQDLIDDDPLVWLDGVEARVIALETYKTSLAEYQRPYLTQLEELGVEDVIPYWAINGVGARVPAASIEALATWEAVRRVDLDVMPDTDSTGDVQREATQVHQYINAGQDGEQGSGKSGRPDIHVALVDTLIDRFHPAWNDVAPSNPSQPWTGSPRLKDVWVWNGGWQTLVGTQQSATADEHGTVVAGALIADLTDGQDPSVTSTSDRDKRTGFTTESSFDFIEWNGRFGSSPTFSQIVQQVVTLNPDIASMSLSSSSICNTDHSWNDIVDAAYHSGIFWTASPDNNASGTSCAVEVPGTAAGVFAVGSYNHGGVNATVSTLRTAAIVSTSPYGGDVHGRSMIKLVAPGGQHFLPDYGYPNYSNSYHSAGIGGVSIAVPHVSGAVADLKDHLLDTLSSSFVNDVGNLYATMLLMGDHQGAIGGTDAIHPRWGVGRLRVRMFNAAGMDAPWRARWCTRTVADSGVYTCDVNPDSSGVNQPLSASVDTLRAAAFWYEPNIGSAQSPADIMFSLCRTSGCYTTQGSEAGAKRLRLGTVVQNHAWQVRLLGLDVPVSTEPNYYHNQDRRFVHIAFFYEDLARDDSDGPPADIQ